jgi:hypothetical protein
MNANVEKAPYAPIGCVLTVIKRFRERGLPDPLTLKEITRVGVSEGNASRTLQALRFLNLVDEEGHRTQTFDRLGRVPTNEYVNVLGVIIKEAYSNVFAIIDPAEATDIEINDAFRYYQPQAQRGRMVSLFRSLCQEAELITGGPPKTRKRARVAVDSKPTVKSRSAILRNPQVETLQTLKTTGTLNGEATEPECVLLQGLLQQLPSSKKWTREKRDRWLQAFTANIDLLIDVEPED